MKYINRKFYFIGKRDGEDDGCSATVVVFLSLNYYILVGVCEDVIISLQSVAEKDMGNRG